MTDREIFLGTVSALADFIRANGTYALRSDVGETGPAPDPRAVMAGLDQLAAGQERDAEYPFWELKAIALELFLRSAPAMADVVRPIAETSANISREAIFDPLTYKGVSDVLHFINNGLLDDDWIALYANDGERRIVNEVADDAIMSQRTLAGLKFAGNLDRDEHWFVRAKRDVLSHKNFQKIFADDLAGLQPSIPTQDDLMTLWLSRPYRDFVSVTFDRGGL